MMRIYGNTSHVKFLSLPFRIFPYMDYNGEYHLSIRESDALNEYDDTYTSFLVRGTLPTKPMKEDDFHDVMKRYIVCPYPVVEAYHDIVMQYLLQIFIVVLILACFDHISRMYLEPHSSDDINIISTPFLVIAVDITGLLETVPVIFF